MQALAVDAYLRTTRTLLDMMQETGALTEEERKQWDSWLAVVEAHGQEWRLAILPDGLCEYQLWGGTHCEMVEAAWNARLIQNAATRNIIQHWAGGEVLDWLGNWTEAEGAAWHDCWPSMPPQVWGAGAAREVAE